MATAAKPAVARTLTRALLLAVAGLTATEPAVAGLTAIEPALTAPAIAVIPKVGIAQAAGEVIATIVTREMASGVNPGRRAAIMRAPTGQDVPHPRQSTVSTPSAAPSKMSEVGPIPVICAPANADPAGVSERPPS
ncbi:MAG: hypothetical protein WBG57_05470 [Ornithinimicrobium sp.]